MYSFNAHVDIKENCKDFIATLIYNNIETGHPRCAHLVLMLKGLDKETIYFNFRLNIGITSFSNRHELVSVTKHVKGRENKMPIHRVRKNTKK